MRHFELHTGIFRRKCHEPSSWHLPILKKALISLTETFVPRDKQQPSSNGCAWLHVAAYCLVSESCLILRDTWTLALQVPLSLGFSRQDYWSGLPFPSPGNLSDPGIKTWSPALQADSLLSERQGKLSWQSPQFIKYSSLQIPNLGIFFPADILVTIFETNTGLVQSGWAWWQCKLGESW